MVKYGTRGQAEARFQKAQRTDQARSTTEDEREAVRKKTAGLRAQRLAKEAAADSTGTGEKPAAPKKRKAKGQA